MFIELIGPAGSGKTTAALNLDRTLRRKALPYLSYGKYEKLNLEIGEKHVLKLGFWEGVRSLMPLLWSHHKLTFPILFLAVLHGPPYQRRFRKAQRSLAHFLFVLRLQQSNPNEIIVLHEGFTQALWSLFVDSKVLRGKRMIRQIFAYYYAIAQQRGIRFVVADECVKRRVFSRQSKGRFNLGSSPQRRQEFNKWLDYHRQLLGLLPSGVIIAEINATCSEKQVAAALTEAIEEIGG